MATTVTIQPDSTIGKDVFIRSDESTGNHDGDGVLLIGLETITFNSLIDFRLREYYSYLRKVLILSAYITFVTQRATAQRSVFNIGHCLRDWVETQANWAIYSTGNNWQTAGGTGANDRELFLSGVCLASEGSGVSIIVPIPHKDIIRQITDSTVYGYITNYSSTSPAVYILDCENATAANRPKLTITYEPLTKIFQVDGFSTEYHTLHSRP